MNRLRCDCSILIPTRNRREQLDDTLRRIHSLPDRGYEILVVDNASTDGTAELSAAYPEVRWILLDDNFAAASRNIAAAAAQGRVLLMLDDDSWPAPGVIEKIVRLFDERLDLGAAGLRVRLADPPHAHDAGGVPGIFFNCGGAIRRSAFVEAGGFPVDYEYYAEEYDLSCRLWRRGWTIEPRGDMLVWHRRTIRNRDNNNMLRLLVRNNLRLWNRYAPEAERDGLIGATIDRYRRVAEKENAHEGFARGMAEVRAEHIGRMNRRRPLSPEQFERLMGVDRARSSLADWADNQRIHRVAVWRRGKGCEQLLHLLDTLHLEIDAIYDCPADSPAWRGYPLRNEAEFRPGAVDGVVPGTLSCGVAEDLIHVLGSRFPSMPIASPAPWERSSQSQLAAASA